MPAPRFLDIEYCQTDDVLFPVAMAWSLEDGQMKTVVIAPADEWIPEDADLGDIDLLYLEEQGVRLIELAQELHQDLPDQTVYVDGMDPVYAPGTGTPKVGVFKYLRDHANAAGTA